MPGTSYLTHDGRTQVSAVRLVFWVERQNAQRSTLSYMRRVCVHFRKILLEAMPLQDYLDKVGICVTHNLEFAPVETPEYLMAKPNNMNIMNFRARNKSVAKITKLRTKRKPNFAKLIEEGKIKPKTLSLTNSFLRVTRVLPQI